MSNAELWDLDTSGGIMEVNNFFKTGKSEHFKFVVKNAVIFSCLASLKVRTALIGLSQLVL